MKRHRDYSDDYHSLLSQFPREEVDPALNYVKKLKTCFQYGQPEEKLHRFSRILEDAMDTKARHDSSVGRMQNVPEHFSARVKSILEVNLDLICGFNSLMPPLYQISIDDEEKKEPEAAMESQRNPVREAMDFVRKMGSKCGQGGCEELLKNFSSYKEGFKSFDEICDFGCTLTRDHPDLLQDFLNFMPTTEATPLAFSLPEKQSSYPAFCRVDDPQKRSLESIKVCQHNKELSDIFVEGTSLQVEGKKIEETTESKEVRYREGMDFVNKLKIKCGEDGCKQFLKIFNLLKEGSRNLHSQKYIYEKNFSLLIKFNES